MKKIYLFLLMLIVGIGSTWADDIVGTWKIAECSTGKLLTDGNDAGKGNWFGTWPSNVGLAENASTQWKISATSTEGQYYIQKSTFSGYTGYGGTSGDEDRCFIDGVQNEYRFDNAGDGAYYIYNVTASKWMCVNRYKNCDNINQIGFTTNKNYRSKFRLGESFVTVTYTYTTDGTNSLFTKQQIVTSGATMPAPSPVFGYTIKSYTNSSSTVSSEVKASTVTIEKTHPEAAYYRMYCYQNNNTESTKKYLVFSSTTSKGEPDKSDESNNATLDATQTNGSVMQFVNGSTGTYGATWQIKEKETGNFCYPKGWNNNMRATAYNWTILTDDETLHMWHDNKGGNDNNYGVMAANNFDNNRFSSTYCDNNARNQYTMSDPQSSNNTKGGGWSGLDFYLEYAYPVYKVICATEGGGVNYGGTTYTDGQYICMSSSDEISGQEAKSISGYKVELGNPVAVSGKTNEYTITVTYTLIEWTAKSDSKFSTEGNWATGSVPASGSDVTFTITDNTTMSIDLDEALALGKVSVKGTEGKTLTLQLDDAKTALLTATKLVPTAGVNVKIVSGFTATNIETVANTTTIFAPGAGNTMTVASVISGAGAVEVADGTVAFSANNTYSGGLTIKSGATAKSGATSATSTVTCFGATTNSVAAADINLVTVENGGAVDITFTNNKSYRYAIAGTGVSNSGAMYCSTEIGYDERQTTDITLTADATISGTAQWGMLGNQYYEIHLNLNGHTLTKAGTGAFLLCNVSDDDTEGKIVVEGGSLYAVNRDNDLSSYEVEFKDGTTLTASNAIKFKKMTVASGATVTVAPTAVITSELAGAGTITLSAFGSNPALTMTNWTGTVNFPTSTGAGNLTAACNAWGTESSIINMASDITGYFNASDIVKPTINIPTGVTVTTNDGSSSSTPTLTKVTGAGTLNHAWSGGSKNTLTITTLTNFTGTLNGSAKPIAVANYVLAAGTTVSDGDKLITTSGTVTLTAVTIGTTVQTAIYPAAGTDGIYASMLPVTPVASTDDIANAKWYKLTVRSKYITYDATSNTFIDKDDDAPTTNVGWFTFVGNPLTGFKIYNYAAGLAFGSDNVNTDTRIIGCCDANAATYIFKKVTISDADAWQIYDSRNTSAMLNQQELNLGIWQGGIGGDTGNAFTFTEVTDAEAKFFVTYNVTATDANSANPITFTFHEFVSKDATTTATPSKSYPFISDYVVTTEDKTITASNRTFVVAATQSYPFVEGKFYQLAARNQSTYLKYESDNSRTYTKSTTNNNDPYQLWYFVRKANTPDRYQVYNVGGAIGITGTGDKSYNSAPSYTTSPTIYQVLKTTNSTTGFALYAYRAKNMLGAHGDYDTSGDAGKLGFWVSGYDSPNDPGNCFWAVEFDDTDLQNIAESAAYVGALVTTTDYIESWEAWSANKTAANLKTLLEDYAELEPREISEDKSYVIENALNSKIGVYEDNTTSKMKYGVISDDDPKFIFKFTNKGTETYNSTDYDTYKLYCCGATGTGYINWGTYDTQVTTGNLADAKAYKIMNNGDTKYNISANANNDNCSLSCGNGLTTLADDADGTLVSWNNIGSTYTNLSNNWRLREVDLPTATTTDVVISNALAATMILGDNVVVPEGVTAKYLPSSTSSYSKDNSNYTLTYTRLKAGETIPANTAVVICGDADTYTFTQSFAPRDVISDNLLFGYTIGTTVSGSEHTDTGTSGTVYALGNIDSKVAFYHFTGTTYKPNKAYLDASSLKDGDGNTARSFSIFDSEDMPTGINLIDAEDETTVADGKYLVNGKVVVVRNGLRYNVSGQVIK